MAGFLAASRHPQVVDPPNGLIVNWNNKPARDFPAGDDRWDEGGVQRDDWLRQGAGADGQAHAGDRARRRERRRDGRSARADVAGGHRDPRRRARAPSPLAQAVVDQITSWSAGDASWVDANGDGLIDAAGQAAMRAVWNDLAGAAMCGRLGASLCAALETRQVALPVAAAAACTAAGTST